MCAIMEWMDANPIGAFGIFWGFMVIVWIYLLDWRLSKIEKLLGIAGKRLD